MNMRRERISADWAKWLVIVIIWVVFALQLQKGLVVGLQADEGVHITLAQEIIRGKVVFRDVFENKMVGAQWLLAGLMRAGAAPVETGRLLSIGAMLLGGVGGWGLVRLVLRRGLRGVPRYAVELGSLVALLIFYLSPLNLFWSRLFMLEPLVVALSAVAGWLLVRAWFCERVVPWLWFGSGACLGMALLVKQTAVVTVTAFGVFVLGHLIYAALFDRTALKKWGQGAILWGAGVGLPWAVFMGALMSQGAWDPFQAQVSGADRIAPLEDIGGKIEAFWLWGRSRPLLALTLIGGGLALPRLLRREYGVLFLPLLWLGAEFSAIFLPPELSLSWGGFSHYILPGLAVASVVAGIGIGLMVDQWEARRLPGRVWQGLAVLLVGATIWGWGNDLHHVLVVSDYPVETQAREARIGRIAGAFIAADEPALVLGNAGFYYWLDREPATAYFHYPGYFVESPIGRTAEADLRPWLTQQAAEPLSALIVTGYHLEQRLPSAVMNPIYENWQVVARLDYPYQRGAYLFVPKEPIGELDESLAVYGDTLGLRRVAAKQMTEDTVSVELVWESVAATDQAYNVFVHLVRPDESRLAQHDGQPVYGFYPTQVWPEGELVVDFHWLDLPAVETIADYELAIGLYHTGTGERLAFADGGTEFRVRVGDVME